MCQAAPGLVGIHINLPATLPPDVAAVLASGGLAPAGLSEKERAAFNSHDTFYKKYRAYGAIMASNYNRRPLAAEVMVDDGRARVIRRRQTIDDMLQWDA